MRSLVAALIAAIVLLVPLSAPAVGRQAASESAERGATCHRAVAEKRKTSVGVHQWTIRQFDRWCARGGRVTSARQRIEVLTGSGWRLISKGGRARVSPQGHATSRSRYHFRLRYGGGYEQNCYPRLSGRLRPSGTARYRLTVGC